MKTTITWTLLPKCGIIYKLFGHDLEEIIQDRDLRIPLNNF